GHAAEAADVDAFGRDVVRPVSELPGAVVTPALDAATRAHGAGVHLTGGARRRGDEVPCGVLQEGECVGGAVGDVVEVGGVDRGRLPDVVDGRVDEAARRQPVLRPLLVDQSHVA